MALSADDLIEKARGQRRRDRYAEAAISARLATERDPRSSNAWWELGLALYHTDDLANAEEAFAQLTTLAPKFAPGWEYLALVLSELDTDEGRVNALETAFKLDGKSRKTLELLLEHRTENGDKSGEYEVLKRMSQLGQLDSSGQFNRLGILHYENKYFHDALIAYRKCASFRDDPASLFNIGLVYNHPEISQDVDAIDAWRLALRRFPGKLARSQERIDAVLPRLKNLAAGVSLFEPTLLPRDQWYYAYLNPFELLNVDQHDDPSSIDARTLQRLKKKLISEIVLEDGRISWLDNHVIDRSRAIALCEELNDEEKREFHATVFRNVELSRFLGKGEHALFLIDESNSPLDLIEQLEDPDEPLAQWLSPIFSRQYDLVLGKALELNRLHIIESLFDGRRWVTPEDNDLCFEIARRHVESLLTPLRNAAASSKVRKPSIKEIDGLVDKTTVAILNLLPTPFRDQQNAAVQQLRAISLNCNNVHDDSGLAKQVNELTRKFHFKSVALNQQLEQDSETLLKMIAEQRKNEVHLTIRQLEWKVTREFVRLGTETLPVDRIDALTWGATHYDDTAHYSMEFWDVDGVHLTFAWSGGKDFGEAEGRFEIMLKATLEYILPHVVERVESTIAQGRFVQIGPCTLNTEGVSFERQRWFRRTQVTVPWSRLRSELTSGVMLIADRTTPSNEIMFPFMATRNSPVLHLLAQRKEGV